MNANKLAAGNGFLDSRGTETRTKGSRKRRIRRRAAASRVRRFFLESLESRHLLAGTWLGTQDLVFDPTPDNASSGDEVKIGAIQYELNNGSDIKVTYGIAGGYQAQFDLTEIHSKINGGALGSADTTGLASDSAFHVIILTAAPTTTLDIQASAVIEARNADALDAGLPTVGTVRVDTGGVTVPPASYFDTVISPGFIPSSTDVEGNTVAFATDPGWVTGDAVRVVAAFGAGTTGLVTPPAATDTTTSATYYLRNIGANTYSLHATYLDATTGASPADITAPLPTTGEIVIVAENDALPFLGQVPRNESFVPTSTKFALTTTVGKAVTTFNAITDEIDIATTAGLVNGDRVRVSISFGGAAVGTTYWVRVLDSDTVSLYTSYATAINTSSLSGRVNLAGTPTLTLGTTLDTVDGDDETVTFAVDPGWATGTGVRVWDGTATGGNQGLSASTTYFVRNLGAGTYSLYSTATYATAGGDLTTGRKDLTGPIADSLFANLTTLSFAEPHGWATGAVVRVSATGGGLASGTNYYVRVIDPSTISLHGTLANAQGNISPVTFTAPITSVVSPLFNGWCIDEDRLIGSNEYVVNIYSSYEASSFPDTSSHPKDNYGTDAGLSPVNPSAVPSSTDLVNDRVTFTANHGWTTGQAVWVAETGGGLNASTTYYVRSISGNTVSFHTTAAGASANTGRVDLTGDIAATAVVFRAESIDFAVTTNWPNGTRIRVAVDDGGLLASDSYYARQQSVVGGAADSNSISLYDTRVQAIAGGATGLVTLTSPVESTTRFYVPENLVEYPENLDVMNWVLNQNFQFQLAAGSTPAATNTANTTQTPTATSYANTGAVPDSTDSTTNESVTYTTDPGFATGTLVRVTATGGGLTAGSNYYVRNLGGGSYSFYSSTANATAGTATGRCNLTANITAGVFAPNLTSSEDTVTFASGHGFVTGSVVNVTAAVGGLQSASTYYLYDLGNETFSFHTASPLTAANKVNLTANITAGVHLQSDDTVTMPTDTPSGWVTGTAVQVSASVGGLMSSTNYYLRGINATTVAFYATAADASNNVNRIDLTEPIATTVRPYYTEGDIQRTVWQLIENNPGDPGGWSQARVNAILAAADAAVGIGQASVDFVPGCGGSVALILQPFEVDQESSAQITVAQITVATVPNFCGAGESSATQQLGSVGDFVWEDTNGNGQQDTDEPGIKGVEVTLTGAGRDGIFGTSDDTTATTITSDDGAYLFSILPAGRYKVSFDAVDDYFRTVANKGSDDSDSDADAEGMTPAFDLASGEHNDNVDAGYYLPASLGDFVWYDNDADGIQDAGEPGAAGILVTLSGAGLDGEFGTSDDVAATTTTSVDGGYKFSELTPGNYRVSFGAVAGYVLTKAENGAETCDSDAAAAGLTNVYTLGSGEYNDTVDAGYVVAATVSGGKFYDANGNGVNDDCGMVAGWPIYLDNDTDPSNGYISRQTTDGCGQFKFENLPPATYYVYEAVGSDGWVQTKGGAYDHGAYQVIVPPGATSGIEFGNLYEVAGAGGKTLGFWTNKNGQLVIMDNSGATSELALLSSLNLVTNSLTGKTITGATAFDPLAYSALRTWLLDANATNMAYMLSAQLTATALAVEAGFLLQSQVVDTKNILDGFYDRINDALNDVYETMNMVYVNEVGEHAFITIGDLMAAANYELSVDRLTLSGDLNRAVQEALKIALDAINNNQLSFVAV